MTNGRVMELPRFLLFSPWTAALSLGAIFGALIELGDGWGFLEAFHPTVLGAVSAGLALWVLFALVPKITVHVMRGLDLKLPRGDSAVPAVGTSFASQAANDRQTDNRTNRQDLSDARTTAPAPGGHSIRLISG